MRLEAARLLYVSITRARASCVLSFALRRMIFGAFEQRTASPFALQTGGAFALRTSGLSHDEAVIIANVVEGL